MNFNFIFYIIFSILFLPILLVQSTNPPLLNGYDQFLNRTGSISNFPNLYLGIYTKACPTLLYVGLVCEYRAVNDYCAFGFSNSGDMTISNVVIAYNSTTTRFVSEFLLKGKNFPSKACSNIESLVNAVCPLSAITNCTNLATLINSNFTSKYIIYEYSIPISVTTGGCQRNIPYNLDIKIIYTLGRTSNLQWPYNVLSHYGIPTSRPDIIKLTPTTGFCPVPTPSPVPAVSPTPSPKSSPVSTPSPVPAVSPTPSPKSSPVPAVSPTSSPVSTPSPVPAVSPTPSPVPAVSPTPSPKSSPVPTVSPTPSPVSTPSPVPAVSPVPSPIPTSINQPSNSNRLVINFSLIAIILKFISTIF